MNNHSLKDSIDSLASAHMNWREQSKLLNTNRQDLINEQPKQFQLLLDGWETINGHMVEPLFK